MIKLLQPRMPSIDAALPYIRRSEEAKHYSNFGPSVKELEDRLSARYAGAYVVTMANATVGLELAYVMKMMAGYRKVELPALTFPATWLAANRGGLEIIPIDVDKDTWIGPGVAGFGVPSYAPVVDAAGAFGEQRVPILKERMTVVFSLHATKTVGAGEGGYCVTWDQAEAEELRSMTNFHIQSGVSTGFGTNAKMSEYTAAMALASLDAYNRDAWLQVFDWYDKYLPSCVVKQKRPRGAYSLLPVKLPCDAQHVLEMMKERGVECRRWYTPLLIDHILFRDPGINRAERRAKKYPSLPVSRDLEKHLLGMPYHLYLTEADVQRVCETLASCVEDLIKEAA